MSETAISGSISPRNIDTVVYRVVRPLPAQGMPGPGAELRVWPQGEVYASVNGCLRPITMGEVGEWLAEGLIEPWGKSATVPAGRATGA